MGRRGCLWAGLGGLLGGTRGGGGLFSFGGRGVGGLLAPQGRVRKTSGRAKVREEEEEDEEESVENSEDGSVEDLPGSRFLFWGGGVWQGLRV